MTTEWLSLISRRNCHLCDAAHALLVGLAATRHVSLSEFDVDEDLALRKHFGDRVPVVLYRGQVIAEGRIDGDHLAQALDAALAGA
ncbi:MAG TPA: glutaredoxin family protein [Candidatus Dormibacteraeota bacterium]|nr:glutaredoxin family protein [Candidatus Dormibacteraeota bacterium]